MEGNNMGKETDMIFDSNAWDDYAEKFNLLSDKMADANITTDLLLDVLEAYENIPQNLRHSLRHNE
jgi:hypothetical protein